MKSLSRRQRAMAAMFGFAVAFATAEALADQLSRYSIVQVVFVRYATHLAFMGLVWGLRDPRSLVRTRRPVFQIARSMLMVGMPASYAFALKTGVDPGSMLSVFWLSPVLLLVLASVFLRERPGLTTWAATVAAYGGALLFLDVKSWPSMRAALFPFGMAATFSAYVVMTRSLRTETRQSNLFYTAFGVALVLAPLQPGRWITPSLPDLLVMMAIGLVGFVSLLAIDVATESAPASAAAPFVFVQLPIALAIASALGGTPVGRRALAGSAIVVVAALVSWAMGGGSETPEPEAELKLP